MGIGESVRMAVEGLRVNKMRSILTMLGIIIGIAAVIGILTVGSGLTGSITDSMSSLGVSNISVSLQQRGDGVSRFSSLLSASEPDEKDKITDEMLEKLQERYPTQIVGVSVNESVGRGTAKDGRLYANVNLTGVNEGYASANGVKLLAGRNIRTEDISGQRSVCMVSDRLVENLFRGETERALGEDVRIEWNGELMTMRIVGVYQYEASAMGLSTASEKDVTTPVYLPISTAKRLNGSTAGYTSLTVQGDARADSEELVEDIRSFLGRYYANNEKYTVTAAAMSSMVESMASIMDTVSVAISVIAGISLLVGGIGVMNIMLVSVTERTKEIGIRKALGATNGDIRGQFVVESMIVCLIGGLIGIALGTLFGWLGSAMLGSGALPRVGHVLLAVGFSMAIGVFFGYYPADKAAQLDPIEALRYE